ncbi:MAG: hypothetical protein LHV69_10540 [Elusimicrobia bacterium]|nr:hypothetical protein [Candidatus Obscuribacterium magneticum]
MKKDLFRRINFNKRWDENDWERYFEALEAYRLANKSLEIRKKPVQKFKFLETDEVDAFEAVLREYGPETVPTVLKEIENWSFFSKKAPSLNDSSTNEDLSQCWGEGAPLASLPVYRECCRFAITVSKEVDRLLRSRKSPLLRKKLKTQCENLKFHANWIAVNIAQGHQIGYWGDRIYGHCAKCRRAIRHADMCISLLNRICSSTKSNRFKRTLFSLAVKLRRILFIWIEELSALSLNS